MMRSSDYIARQRRSPDDRCIIHVIDTNFRKRAALARVVFAIGHHPEVYDTFDELTEQLPDRGIVLAVDDHTNGGIETLIDQIRTSSGWLPVIAFANEAPHSRVVKAIRAGAFDYLKQPMDADVLDATIRHVSQMAAGQSDFRRRVKAARMRIAMLTDREREVLDLLAQGCSHKAIGCALKISPRTVEQHRDNLRNKLKVHCSAEAVRLRLEASMYNWLH